MAFALSTWLPNVIQSIHPFMSDEISKGAQGLREIYQALDDAGGGVVCVTADNQNSPWLNFEAGALAAKFRDQRPVIPFLLDISPGALREPLGSFQAAVATREGTWGLVRSLDVLTDSPLGEVRLQRAFDAFWPELNETISTIPPLGPSSDHAKRDVGEMVEEILEMVRAQSRQWASVNTTRTANVTYSNASGDISGWTTGVTYNVIGPTPSVTLVEEIQHQFGRDALLGVDAQTDGSLTVLWKYELGGGEEQFFSMAAKRHAKVLSVKTPNGVRVFGNAPKGTSAKTRG